VNHERDGGLVVLDHEVRRLHQELGELERRPERLEPLREILLSVQRLRHASDPDEPRPVRMLRNAVEKVTLHVGRSRLAVTPDVLDFYVDTVDLLEDAVRRWPDGGDFDPRRYADRVRDLLGTFRPTRDEVRPAAVPPMAEEVVDEAVADSIELTEPEAAGVGEAGAAAEGAGGGGVLSAAGVVEVEEQRPGDAIELPDDTGAAAAAPYASPEEAPAEQTDAAAGEETYAPAGEETYPPGEETYAPSPEGTPAPERRPAVQVLSADELSDEDLSRFVYADLRDLLAPPPQPGAGAADWGGTAAGLVESPPGDAGGLAASFSTFEALRDAGESRGFAAPAPRPGGSEALAGLRDVLDAFSLSLQDLERASDRLMDDAGAGLGAETFGALAGRLDAEKRKLLEVFDRAIESFRGRAG
jgi:hypothetical protein